jgi:hypothetical protein
MAKNPRKDREWRDPIRKSEIATDFGISLARIQWDFFATPTFAGNVPKPQIAYGLAWRWLQELAKVCGVGQIQRATKELTLARTVELLWAERKRVKTITADNGTEFHNYPELESILGTQVYFATPHHAWE